MVNRNAVKFASAVAVIAMAGQAAQAAPACPRDRGLLFGRVRIDARYADLAKAFPKVRAVCPRARSMRKDEDGCEFKGADGVTYWVAEDQVFRKELNVGVRPLPAGLTASDTPQTAMAKLARAGLKGNLLQGGDGPAIIMQCPTGVDRDDWTVDTVEFDRSGRVAAVTQRTHFRD